MQESSSSGPIYDFNGYADKSLRNKSVIHTSRHNTLYKAQRYGKFFAFKTLSENFKGSEIYETQLAKEFSIHILMNHPNIAHPFSFEFIPGMGNCIIMEYVYGFTLTDWLKLNPSHEERLRVLTQLLDATAHIHSHQIIHRDLKPKNILITRNGHHVKVIDFGLSDSESYAFFKQPAGTLKYMAPEQKDPSVQLDQRADIYALGIIIKEIFPNKFQAIIKRCCQERREDRFHSASEVLTEIQKRSQSKFGLIFPILSASIVGLAFFLFYQSSSTKEVKEVGRHTEVIDTVPKIVPQPVSKESNEKVDTDTTETTLATTKKSVGTSEKKKRTKSTDSSEKEYEERIEKRTKMLKETTEWAFQEINRGFRELLERPENFSSEDIFIMSTAIYLSETSRKIMEVKIREKISMEESYIMYEADKFLYHEVNKINEKIRKNHKFSISNEENIDSLSNAYNELKEKFKSSEKIYTTLLNEHSDLETKSKLGSSSNHAKEMQDVFERIDPNWLDSVKKAARKEMEEIELSFYSRQK
jgi:serine/threonine protein kinase